MKKIKVLRIVLIILIIVWAYLVFSFSSQDGGESSGFSRMIIELFTKDEAIINVVEPYVRKFAHFSEYALGGVLFLGLCNTYNWSDRKKLFISIFLGVWYAISDEVHQLLVPARNGNLIDVWIDSLGIATGTCVMMANNKIRELISNKKMAKAE
jgi:VanZ family protein